MVKAIMILGLGIFSYWDIKKGWIHAGWILVYVVTAVVGAVLIQNETFFVMAGGIIGGVLWFAAIISKEKWIGKADGAVMLALGCVYGLEFYWILFLSSVLVLGFLLIKKKKEIPFLPFLLVAVIITEGGGLFG